MSNQNKNYELIKFEDGYIIIDKIRKDLLFYIRGYNTCDVIKKHKIKGIIVF